MYRGVNFYFGLIIFVALGLRIFVASDSYLHPWDERFHALVAKHMMEAPLRPTLYTEPVLPDNGEHWSAGHLWLHKQPLPLWTMAGSMHLLGVNEWALRLPSVFLSTLSVWLLFLLGRRLFDDTVGLIAAFLLAINGLVLDLTAGSVATDHIDLYFLFFILWAIFFAERHSQKGKWIYTLGVGLATGAAILCKWLPALIIFPVWGLIYIHFRKRIDRRWYFGMILAASLAFVVSAPWQFYILRNFPEEAAYSFAYNRRHIFEALDGHGQPLYYHLLKVGRIYGVLMYAVLAWLIFRIRQSQDDRYKYLALLCWIGLPLLFFSLAKTKMQAYTIFSAPAYFMVYGMAVQKAWIAFFDKSRLWRSLILLILFLQPLIYSIERIDFMAERSAPEWKLEIQTLKKKIEADSLMPDTRILVLNASHPIETMFYLDRTTAYGFSVSKTVQDSLCKEGYQLYWMD